MISVPVFSDENGTPQVSMYVEDEDGTFRRTQSEPLRLLRDDIKGISISQGDIVTPAFDRYEREWNTPTVTFHYGRPQSFYYFLRSKVVHNRFFVFTKPQLAGHISRLSLHELQLKNSTSQRKISILKEKYIEAVELWSEEELEKLTSKEVVPERAFLATEFTSNPADNVNAGMEEKNVVKATSRITYFRRKGSAEEDRQQTCPDTELRSQFTDSNPVEQDFNKRKNLIQEFSLVKPQPLIRVEQKAHNKHFFRRFIFWLD